MIPRRWRALALAAPSLAALLLPLAAPAREPAQPTHERKRTDWMDQGGFGRAGTMPPVTRAGINALNVGPQGSSAGVPVRRVTPDEDRMRELSGQVVKLNGMVLYVQTQVGAVVPLDLSALQLRKMPQKGQEVVAVYQVENTTENVALSLAGEVTDKG
ncbi:hypothetical protein HPC49_20120 [Pyxidicoccus fallax]|uniref:Uncharacterized protein n=1 Tax=Pyxidicoccus fallax TaxID=394095 RepID=A0A848LMM0_9BACT|nr:hypothetical protein [Pyxidicoccus fallax]NMO18873.1 hypothetical protein [Pyxidicoccus fallax]NPC80518.1 hypothetical protein [Pyxidicoccus fallax]